MRRSAIFGTVATIGLASNDRRTEHALCQVVGGLQVIDVEVAQEVRPMLAQASGKAGILRIREANPPMIEKTLVVWAAPANLQQQGGSALTLQSGPEFDAIVIGEKARGKWMAGSDLFHRTEDNQGAYPPETVDADTLVDRSLLSAFDVEFRAGHLVQQGYNYISNPWASPFTRIIAVTGVLRNGRYYAGKTALGLPGMLTGTGMCLGAEVLNRWGWTAFSVGEDWEFSVELLLGGQYIYFNQQ